MYDFISREAAQNAVQKHFDDGGFDGYTDGQLMMTRICDIPASDVAPVRQGRWYLDNGCAFCSECKNSFTPKIRSQALFCPRCGAKMLSSTNVEAEWQYRTMSVPGGKGQTYAKWSCSACKRKQVHRSRYCPNCGKRMKNGGQNE